MIGVGLCIVLNSLTTIGDKVLKYSLINVANGADSFKRTCHFPEGLSYSGTKNLMGLCQVQRLIMHIMV